jgi:hypothetical protein
VNPVAALRRLTWDTAWSPSVEHPPAVEATRPKLTITAAPKAKLSTSTATFRFKADKPGSTFRCKLDGKAFVKCRSPKTYKA